MAPQFANIFMADLEQCFLNSYPLKPRVYFRFIDDIFMIWTHGLDALKKFYQDFNSFHNTINFTMEYSDNAINFLDTTVKIRDDHLETSLYRKPTDSRSYLQPSSFHPQHTFRSIVYSQALRYNKICSEKEDRDKQLGELHQTFTQLKYKPCIVEKQITRASHINRGDLLQYGPKTNVSRVPLVVTYNPQLKCLQRIINDFNPS
ncbi:uncharacterized protein [Ptychodera flava]|uniref:uncharacterized protein n=1 Tax=Ptychodera flava TaxID=63121 RepID=UPI00396A7C56